MATTDFVVKNGLVVNQSLNVKGATQNSGNILAWNTTTPGTGVGGVHLGAASATADAGPAITFGARDSSSGATAQAGIYVTSGGGFGTRMYLATTDAYASGSKVALSIGATGVVNIVRNTASDSTTTGSLVVTGGVGISGNLYTGGNMYITNTGPVLVLRDTDSTGANQIGYLSFQDNTSTERAWIGYGTTANDTFNIQNNYSGGLTFNGNTIWHAGNDGPGTGLDADTLDNKQLDTLVASLRANRNITGGGTITFDSSSNLLWSARFIVIANGRGTHFSTNGYFDIECPTSGTITGVGGAASVTATTAGIPIGGWTALYYIMPIGSGNGSLAANFRVASYTADLVIPDEWVLIALRNSDTGQGIYLHNGYRLEPGQSIDTTVYDAKFANTAAFADTAAFVSSRDIDRNAANTLPTTSPQAVRFDFTNASSTGTGGNYSGTMTFAPYTGTTASTGDASYQLVFGSTATNGGGIPKLNIRKGIDSTWNSWYTLIHSGNTARSTWNDFGNSIALVSGELAWKNYGNNHTIFDASNGTAPNGTAVNNTNAQVAWTGTYPTLMGWNGTNTYGVRVDSARLADDAGTLDGIDSLSFIRKDVAGDWQLASSTNDASYPYAALELREFNFAGAGTGAASEAPRLSFHWGGRVASQIAIETNARIAIRNNPGTAYENLIAATIYGNTAVQTTSLTTGAEATNGTVTGQWTLVGSSTFQATFADLAEWYDSDEDYESGTVLVFGGENEVTISSTANDHRVAGVVTTNPAFIMNVDRPGPSACVALQGKVPCKVIGQVNKGDLLVSSNVPGYAMANNNAGPYRVIGKAMENKTTEEQGTIYISVGR